MIVKFKDYFYDNPSPIRYIYEKTERQRQQLAKLGYGTEIHSHCESYTVTYYLVVLSKTKRIEVNLDMNLLLAETIESIDEKMKNH